MDRSRSFFAFSMLSLFPLTLWGVSAGASLSADYDFGKFRRAVENVSSDEQRANIARFNRDIAAPQPHAPTYAAFDSFLSRKLSIQRPEDVGSKFQMTDLSFYLALSASRYASLSQIKGIKNNAETSTSITWTVNCFLLKARSAYGISPEDEATLRPALGKALRLHRANLLELLQNHSKFKKWDGRQIKEYFIPAILGSLYGLDLLPIDSGLLNIAVRFKDSSDFAVVPLGRIHPERSKADFLVEFKDPIEATQLVPFNWLDSQLKRVALFTSGASGPSLTNPHAHWNVRCK